MRYTVRKDIPGAALATDLYCEFEIEADTEQEAQQKLKLLLVANPELWKDTLMIGDLELLVTEEEFEEAQAYVYATNEWEDDYHRRV